jgi:hypothetical protein
MLGALQKRRTKTRDGGTTKDSEEPAMKRATIVTVLGLLAALGGGCNYYAVTDMGSGRMYYTRQIKQHAGSRQVSFKDAETGLKVTLPNSEVAKISESEYRRNIRPGEPPK